ncbi:hypothetical protein BCON_0200g00050 [Botryotinia convoluta]|uniref:Uncharacterized protein n=1 Tax=Botryotinia convoluta TaxID=54673 RepID=A0A4Z1HL08_9HELO|nr:hypothetical protein BCON_0200g00050 [Botryotinia convoluta]
MPSSTAIGTILVVVVVGTVCGLAGLYYWGNRGKGWSGPSQHTSRHSSRAHPLVPPRIIPPYRNGIPGARASHISSEVPSPTVRNTSGRQATLPGDRQPPQSSQHDRSRQPPQTDLNAPQPIQPQPIKPQQLPQQHPVQPQPPLRIIIPPPVAGGLYGLKGVFPQPKRGGRSP